MRTAGFFRRATVVASLAVVFAAVLAPIVFAQEAAGAATANRSHLISVALGLLPTKGIPLPFVSFGGSSLLINLLGMGILLNVSQHASTEEA